MDKRRAITVFVSIILILSIGWILFEKNNKDKETLDINLDNNIYSSDSSNKSIVDDNLKKILPGIKTSSLEILDNPVRISGEIYIPSDNIYDILINFLKQTNNDLISDLNIQLDNNLIQLSAKYKILGFLNILVSASIEPSIDTTGDIRLSIKDINISKININDKVITSVVETWIKDEELLKSDGKAVLIDKSILGNIKISNIEIKNSNIICAIELHL